MSVTSVPTVRLEVDGGTLEGAALRGLSEVCVRQRLSMPTQCELTFERSPGAPELGGGMTPGARLRVRVAGRDIPLFEGDVTALEHTYGPGGQVTVRVRGYDRLHRLRKRSPVRVHVDVTPLSLAQELAGSVGLDVAATEAGPRLARLMQHDRNDLALLAEFAARAGLYLCVREGTLHLLTLAGMEEPIPLVWGQTLLEAVIEVNTDMATHTVEVAGWNPPAVEAHEGRADRSRNGQPGGMVVAPAQVGGDGYGRRMGAVVADNRHAEALAQADLERRRAYDVTLWGVAEGDTRLRPGARVTLSGVAPAVAERFVLTEVTHRLGEHGFVSELSSLPPVPPMPALPHEVAALGEVVQVNDPQEVGRVRVRLPGYQGLESAWLPVLLPGASAAKGLVVLPDVGDRVLVLLPGGDPSEGVVLGCLAGARGLHDSGVDGNAVRRYTLRTPGGQQVQLDDGGMRVRLENADGSFVELTPTQLLIHAARDLTLEAPGKQVKIRGRAIDFERA